MDFRRQGESCAFCDVMDLRSEHEKSEHENAS